MYFLIWISRINHTKITLYKRAENHIIGTASEYDDRGKRQPPDMNCLRQKFSIIGRTPYRKNRTFKVDKRLSFTQIHRRRFPRYFLETATEIFRIVYPTL